MEAFWQSPEAKAKADARFESALLEAEKFFMHEGRVHSALHKIVAELDRAGIPYAIAGGLALNARGFERVTVDVDILLTREGLASLKQRVLGLGWVEKFPGSKGLRDTEFGVNIDILITGEFPGDGKPKSVSFPDPAALKKDMGATPYLPIETLIELKLASGMSAPHRGQDLIDVQRLIHAVNLPQTLADRLDPSVREKYRELWALAQVHDPISDG